MRPWPALALVALLASALPAPGAPGGEVEIRDPAGDAKLYGTSTARAWLCDDLTTFRSACEFLPAEDAGVDAPPAYDILSLDLDEAPDALLVTLEVAGFEDGFRGAVADDGSDVLNYAVCWTTDESPCSESLFLSARRAGGEARISSVYQSGSVACSYWRWCSVAVPPEYEPGSPGRIRWAVPREALLNGTLGDSLDRLFVQSAYYSESAEFSRTSTVMTPVYWDTRQITPGYGTRVDAAAGSPYAFRTPAVPSVGSPGAWSDPARDVTGEAAPDLDVLETELVETTGRLAIRTTLADVQEGPTEHSLFVALSFGGPVYTAGVVGKSGSRATWGGYCHDPTCEEWSEFAVALRVEPGAPGTLELSLPRIAIGSPAAGSLVRLLYVSASRSPDPLDLTTGLVAPGLPRAGAVVRETSWDWGGSAPPFRLELDSEEEPSLPSFRFDDSAGDVRLPADHVGPVVREQLDITFAHVNRTASGELRLALGILDLTDLELPTGYDAVVYGVAVETDAGPFLAFFRKTEDPEPKFFCGPDTIAFADRLSDPVQAYAVPIFGMLARSAADPGAPTGGRSGSVILFVPPACLGVTAEDTVQVSRVAGVVAGVRGAGPAPLRGLLGQAGAEPVTVFDEVRHDDALALAPVPALLAAAAAPRPEAPWYAEPFGIANFWDIAGLGAAGLGSLLGLLLVWRRRSRLKRLLREVEEAARTPDLLLRERALGSLRERAKDLLVRGRLAEGHYVVVQERIDEHLARARVETLAEAFGDLPHRLLKRLEDLLRDGRMSREDFRAFASLLDETPLEAHAKARILARLERWVAEDRFAVEASA